MPTFSQTQSGCSYTLTETFTVTVQPQDPTGVITYNSATRLLSVVTSSNSMVGEYTCVLKATNPYDSTNFNSITFKVTISLCGVTINFSSQ